MLHNIRVGGAVGKCRTGTVLDHVRGSDELAVWKALAFVRTTARASLLAVLPTSTGFTVGFAGAPVAGAEVAAGLGSGLLVLGKV